MSGLRSPKVPWRRGLARKARITIRRCKAWRGIFRIADENAVERPAGERCTTPSCPAPAKIPVSFTYKDGVRAYTVTKPFEGVLRNLERRWRETDSAWVREELSRYQSEKPCADLRRRAPEARGAVGPGRRQKHRRGVGTVDPRRTALVRTACCRR